MGEGSASSSSNAGNLCNFLTLGFHLLRTGDRQGNVDIVMFCRTCFARKVGGKTVNSSAGQLQEVLVVSVDGNNVSGQE